jgi:hypothetical protein
MAETGCEDNAVVRYRIEIWRAYALAGLWEKWRDREAMDYDRWLKSGDPERPPIDLLRPFDADKMTAWKVDKAVGNVKNDSPDLLPCGDAATALP